MEIRSSTMQLPWTMSHSLLHNQYRFGAHCALASRRYKDALCGDIEISSHKAANQYISQEDSLLESTWKVFSFPEVIVKLARVYTQSSLESTS